MEKNRYVLIRRGFFDEEPYELVTDKEGKVRRYATPEKARNFLDVTSGRLSFKEKLEAEELIRTSYSIKVLDLEHILKDLK